MKKQGYIRALEDGILSNTDPLVEEIKSFLKDNHDITLSDLEFYMVSKILDVEPFRNL